MGMDGNGWGWMGMDGVRSKGGRRGTYVKVLEVGIWYNQANLVSGTGLGRGWVWVTALG